MKSFLYNLATDKYRGVFASCVKFFLLLLSLFYGLIVRTLILLYSFSLRRLKCRVISVGNITLGGTGKSSLVEQMARYLSQQGHKVAVLSRGYKRIGSGMSREVKGYEEMGDEPYMLQMHLSSVPVIVDADRIRGANLAIREFGADTVILDDGFQQWKIKKDLEIVTVDAANPLGNGHLLPRGILREPVSHLRRADVFVLTKTNLKPDWENLRSFLSRINPAAEILESVHKPLGFYRIGSPEVMLSPESLRGETVTLFCGIGDPESFERLIKSMGANVGLSFKFQDHHNYTHQDLGKIVEASKARNINTIITTEKDAVRLDKPTVDNLGVKVLVLRIEQVIKDEQRLHNRLLQLYRV